MKLAKILYDNGIFQSVWIEAVLFIGFIKFSIRIGVVIFFIRLVLDDKLDKVFAFLYAVLDVEFVKLSVTRNLAEVSFIDEQLAEIIYKQKNSCRAYMTRFARYFKFSGKGVLSPLIEPLRL